MHLRITHRKQTLTDVLNRTWQTLPQPLYPDTAGHSSCPALLWSYSVSPLCLLLVTTAVHTSGTDTREVSRQLDELAAKFFPFDSSILLALQLWEQTLPIWVFTKLTLCGSFCFWGSFLLSDLVVLNHRLLWPLCLGQWIYLNSISWDPICANPP